MLFDFFYLYIYLGKRMGNDSLFDDKHVLFKGVETTN